MGSEGYYGTIRKTVSQVRGAVLSLDLAVIKSVISV